VLGYRRGVDGEASNGVFVTVDIAIVVTVIIGLAILALENLSRLRCCGLGSM